MNKAIKKSIKKSATIARRFGVQDPQVVLAKGGTIRVVGTGKCERIATRMSRAYGLVSTATKGMMGWAVSNAGFAQLHYDGNGTVGLEFIVNKKA